MLGTGAKLASRLDLAPLRDIASQAGNVFVVNLANVIDAETTNFASSSEATAAAPRATAGAAWSTAATGCALSRRRARPSPLRTGREATSRAIIVATVAPFVLFYLIVVAHGLLLTIDSQVMPTSTDVPVSFVVKRSIGSQTLT
jgi:hypothetical protein